jgi:hypothetical protein
MVGAATANEAPPSAVRNTLRRVVSDDMGMVIFLP